MENKGQLKTWKDDRGFGFIKPDDSSKEVFLHISALKGSGRRPKVGDTILYQQVVEPNGKVRASQASIQGVASLPLPTQHKPRSGKRVRGKTVFGIGILAFMGILTIFNRNRFSSPITPVTNPITAIPKPGCMIKGNISVSTGNKVYHLPGMEDYESTIIDPTKGEKWFCTQSEAIANGWRKAPR